MTSNIQKIFESTDLKTICESSIGAPINSIFATKKNLLNNWTAECFTTETDISGNEIFKPIILKVESTNADGETLMLNVPKYLAYGKIGIPKLDSMDINIEWFASSQFSRSSEENVISNTNINVSKLNTSETANVAAKVSVNMKISGNITSTSADDTFKSLSEFIAAQNSSSTAI
jgi:hypothetical protein